MSDDRASRDKQNHRLVAYLLVAERGVVRPYTFNVRHQQRDVPSVFVAGPRRRRLADAE
jgi:hypothetical protein